jgi:hypothetical protein
MKEEEKGDKIKEAVKNCIFMNEEEQKKHIIKKRIEKHIKDYQAHLLMLDIHGDKQVEMIKEETERFIKTLEKEEKLKQHIENYVTFLQASNTPVDEDMIQNETKRFKQILENE